MSSYSVVFYLPVRSGHGVEPTRRVWEFPIVTFSKKGELPFKPWAGLDIKFTTPDCMKMNKFFPPVSCMENQQVANVIWNAPESLFFHLPSYDEIQPI